MPDADTAYRALQAAAMDALRAAIRDPDAPEGDRRIVVRMLTQADDLIRNLPEKRSA